MKNYYGLWLGTGGVYAKQCYENGSIGVDFGFNENLSEYLSGSQIEFNKYFMPLWLEGNDKPNKIAAGLACATVWKVINNLKEGDIVICPDGDNACFIGEITGKYVFEPDKPIAQRRYVKWSIDKIEKSMLSNELKKSIYSFQTLKDISKYASEIESLHRIPNESLEIETESSSLYFGLEKHLEEFLIEHWDKTELGKNYEIYRQNNEIKGQQFPCDTGYIDILAISKDQKELLVVELKRGRSSDRVVGQILRYMGYVKTELATTEQSVKGVIIALEDDLRIKRALSVTNNIEFYRYEITFKLTKN
jgi:restriction system protein